jgi:replicative DNA helicase
MTAEILPIADKTPQNLDAEQALLEAILVHNGALRYVTPKLAAEHFWEPVHQRIYEAILHLHGKGQVASPVTLKHYFDQDQGLSEIGGGQYLARLAAAAVTVINVTDVSEVILDLALRRNLIAVCHGGLERLYHDTTWGIASEIAAELSRKAGDVIGVQEDGRFMDDVEITQDILDSVNQCREPYSTGIPKLDSAMGGGLHPGFSYGFAARKKTGKTIMAGTISHNLSQQGTRHLFICGEMSPKEVHQRNLCRELQVFPSEFNGMAKGMEFQKRVASIAGQSKQACLYRKAPGLTFTQLRQIVSSAVERMNITGVILDYWQLVGGKPSADLHLNHFFVSHCE